MDDLSKKLNDLLSSPDSMDKIRSAMASLGMDGGDDEPPAPETDTGGGMGDALQSLLAGFMNQPPEKEKPAPAEGGGLPDLSMLTKIAPLMAGLNKEDENTALLKALRPYLHGDREKRLDDAIQIMKFMKFMPLLQDKGLF